MGSRTWFARLGRVLLASLLLLSFAAMASAAEWSSCDAKLKNVECTFITVPLDYSGKVPGTLSLRVARSKLIDRNRDWLLFLTGGPGGGNGVTAADVISELAPLKNRFNFLFYDQRGTSASGPLNCPKIQAGARDEKSVAECADQLGPNRIFYTTENSTKDINGITDELGLGDDRLTLLGSSYGTRLALVFAREYSQKVKRLILDGVSDPDSTDAFGVAAVDTVVESMVRLCPGTCQEVSHAPSHDLGQLIRKLEAKPEQAVTYKKNEQRNWVQHVVPINPQEVLVDLLVPSSPYIRGLFPAAIKSALDNNPRPLARLLNLPSERSTSDRSVASFSEARNLTTHCLEDPLPWQHTTSQAARPAEVKKSFSALAPASYAPLPPNSFELISRFTGGWGRCLGWPTDAITSPQKAPYPTVPTLLLGGREDTQTPKLAAMHIRDKIPGSKLVLETGAGHSVIQDKCPLDQIDEFLAGKELDKNCEAADAPDLRPATPLPRVFDQIKPLKEAKIENPSPTLTARQEEKVQKTLAGFLETIRDAHNMAEIAKVIPGRELPGLYGGTVGEKGLETLREYSVIEGLKVTVHKVKPGAIFFRVDGSNAAGGAVLYHRTEDNKIHLNALLGANVEISITTRL